MNYPKKGKKNCKQCLNTTGEIGVVGLDVVRTDRALVFYDSEANQAKLWDILAVYAWVDNDIGYVQGGFLLTSFFTVKLEQLSYDSDNRILS